MAFGSDDEVPELVDPSEGSLDHPSLIVHFSLLLLGRFNRRKRSVYSKWHMDETYIRLCRKLSVTRLRA